MMTYRMDWSIHFRANRLDSAQRLFNRLARAIDEKTTPPVFEPWHRKSWKCQFSIGDWPLSLPEVVVRCIELAGAVAYPRNWHYSTPEKMANESPLFSEFFAVIDPSYQPGTWLTGLEWAEFALVPAESRLIAFSYEHEVARNTSIPYAVWIEAEEWGNGQLWPHLPAGDWSLDDACSDIKVTFMSGASWCATFVTYKNVATLRQKIAMTGKHLGGRYLQLVDMVLIEDISRETIEAVIGDMLNNRTFDRAFSLEGVLPGGDDAEL